MSETPVHDRTPEEMEARRLQALQQQAATQQQAQEIPPLVHVTLDRERMQELQQEAERWRPDTAATALVQLALEAAGSPIPPGRTALEVAWGLRRLGWACEQTEFANPIPGAIFALRDPNGEWVRLGIVAKRHEDQNGKVLRDYFHEAGALREKVEYGAVACWLFAPGSCGPCVQRFG